MTELPVPYLLELGVTMLATVGFLWLGWQAVQALKK
jgi:hypothetical protein